MIIALDGRTVYSPQRRGTGKNLIDLYRCMSEFRPDWRFVAFRQIDIADDPFENCPNITSIKIDIPGDRWDFWRKVRLPLAAKKIEADVLHCPANVAAGPSKMPQVVTVHDLIPLDERFSADSRQRKKWLKGLLKATRRASAIITPSEFSKKEIQRICPHASDKITVNHWAADSACSEVTDSDVLKAAGKKYGLTEGKKFVLALGGADPRKNTERIIRAWSLIDSELRGKCSLLIVGNQPAVLGKFRNLANSLNLDASCQIEGFAAEQDMASLISAAEVMCYPSLSEGFGLPVLDSFVCRTALLTANATSLPEVAADAALLVDPQNEQEIAAGLSRLLTDESLRNRLIQKGSERLKKFTWQRCAQRAIDVFAVFEK